MADGVAEQKLADAHVQEIQDTKALFESLALTLDDVRTKTREFVDVVDIAMNSTSDGPESSALRLHSARFANLTAPMVRCVVLSSGIHAHVLIRRAITWSKRTRTAFAFVVFIYCFIGPSRNTHTHDSFNYSHHNCHRLPLNRLRDNSVLLWLFLCCSYSGFPSCM